MAGQDEPPNRGRWALLFGLGSALVAALIQAVLSYYTVVGIRIDWLRFPRRPTVASDVAAASTGLAVALHVLVLGIVAGALTWYAAKKNWLRTDPPDADQGAEGPPQAWSEAGFSRAAGYAVAFGLLALIAGFLAAELSEGAGLDSQAFFVFQVSVAALAAGVGAILVSWHLAAGIARGDVVEENPQGSLVSRIQLWSGKNATTVVLAAVLIIGGIGFGITKIETDVNVADLLPRGNPNTEAAQNVSREFKSTFTQQVTLQFRTNVPQCEADAQRVLGPERAEQIDCGNISAEPYVRGLEELYQMALANEDTPIRYTIGLNSFYKLINWTIAGGQNASDAAFALPPVEGQVQGQSDPTGISGNARYQMVDEGVWQAIPDTVTPIIDPSFEQTASLYLVPTTYAGESQTIGHEMLEFRDEYVQAVENGETTWKVWGEEKKPLFTVDIPVANAHQSDLAREDFQTLFPLIFGFIIVALYFSFRSFTAISITASTLLGAATITYGAMGWMGIPLNTLNLTVLPLILGSGIDYAIHQTTEFAHFKREGLSDEEALRESGALAGFAMFIATATTVAGLLVMTISPSLLMAQVGALAAIAMVSIYLLTIMLMPALLALAPSSEAMGEGFESSGLTKRLARLVSNHRLLAAALVVLVTTAAVVGMQNLTIEEFGEPAQNFPEDDWLREEHEVGLRGFYDLDEKGADELKTNIVVFQGDNTDIQSHRYMEALQDEMRTKEHLNLDTSRTVPFLIRNWMTVKDGLPSAGEQTVREQLWSCNAPSPPDPIPTNQDCSIQQANNYPQTRQAILHELDTSFQSPLSTFGSLFADHPNYNITILTVATTTGDFEDAEAAWHDVWDSIEATETQQPHDLSVAFVGNTALNYLFINEELPWLSYLGYASGATLLTLTAIFTKRVRAVLAVGTIMGLTSIWWLGALPAFDIGLAITLMLPAVFITSIGSDYAIHMTWNMIRNPNREEVYGVVGKAVLFSAITDIGAFAIFTQTQNIAAARAMLATVIAIAIMFFVTVLVMPLFYPYEPADTDAPEEAPTTRVVDKSQPAPDAA